VRTLTYLILGYGPNGTNLQANIAILLAPSKVYDPALSIKENYQSVLDDFVSCKRFKMEKRKKKWRRINAG